MNRNLNHLLALLYGRWYQEVDESLGELDAFVLDPQGRRFAAPSLRDFLMDWGYADLISPETLEVLLSLHRQDFREILGRPQTTLSDLQAQVVLRLLQDDVEEVDCWDDWRTFPSVMFFTWEGQWRPTQQFKYTAPPMAAVYLAALRGVREVSWTLNLRNLNGASGQVYTHAPEVLWRGLLTRQRPWRLEESEEGGILPTLPVALEATRYYGCVVLLSWQGQEVRLGTASMKLLDAVTFLVDMGVTVRTQGVHVAPILSLPHLRQWLQAEVEV